MSERRREGGMWAAASGNCCFLFGLVMMTSQTAVPETTSSADISGCINTVTARGHWQYVLVT